MASEQKCPACGGRAKSKFGDGQNWLLCYGCGWSYPAHVAARLAAADELADAGRMLRACCTVELEPRKIICPPAFLEPMRQMGRALSTWDRASNPKDQPDGP